MSGKFLSTAAAADGHCKALSSFVITGAGGGHDGVNANGPWFADGIYNGKPKYKNTIGGWMVWENGAGNLNAKDWAYSNLGTSGVAKWTISWKPNWEKHGGDHLYYSQQDTATPPVSGWTPRDGYASGEIALTYQADLSNSGKPSECCWLICGNKVYWTNSIEGCAGMHLLLLNSIKPELNPGLAAASSTVWGGSRRDGETRYGSFLNHVNYGAQAAKNFDDAREAYNQVQTAKKLFRDKAQDFQEKKYCPGKFGKITLHKHRGPTLSPEVIAIQKQAAAEAQKVQQEVQEAKAEYHAVNDEYQKLRVALLRGAAQENNRQMTEDSKREFAEVLNDDSNWVQVEITDFICYGVDMWDMSPYPNPQPDDSSEWMSFH